MMLSWRGSIRARQGLFRACCQVRSQHTAGSRLLFPAESQLQELVAGLFERLKNPKKGTVLKIDGPDPVAAGHVCATAPHTLRETPLKQLPGGQIAKGACTTLTTFTPAAPAFSLIVPVRDSAGTATLISMRNWQPTTGTLSVAEAGALLPAGSVIRVLEPYLMRSAGGGAMLRVDNPANIQIVSRPGLTLDAGGSPERAEALAAEAESSGKAHLDAGRPAAALDFFSAALSLGDLLPPTRRAAVLSKRATAALNLNRFAAALLDCDKALALHPANGTAALLRCDALLCTNRSAGAVAFAQAELATAGEVEAAAGDEAAAEVNRIQSVFIRYMKALLQKARAAATMRAGKLDMTTLPFTQEEQRKHGIANHVGPIAVRDTGTAKGWGVFLTRDVKAEELLLIERPLYARYAAADDVIGKQASGEEYPDHGITAGLTYLVQTPSADADGQTAAKLATLHSAAGPRWALEPPSEAALRGEAFLPVPPASVLSAKHIRGIKVANSFGASTELQEPTPEQRRPFAWQFDPAMQAQARAAEAFVQSQQKQLTLMPNTILQGAALADLLKAAQPAGTAGPGGPPVRTLNAFTGPPASPASADASATGTSTSEPTQLQQLLQTLPAEELKAMLDVQDANGMTALHFAVEFGRLEDVQALLAAGANPNLADKRNLTPLLVVAALRCNDSEAMLTSLLDAGADVNAVAPGCGTPLQEAMDSNVQGSTAMVRLLLARGADPLILYPNGLSLLRLLHSEDHKSDRERRAAGAHDWAGKVALLEAAGFDRARYAASTHEGAALYWIASFFNHASDRSAANTQRINIGGLMIVLAERDMRAGTELTTVYDDDEARLRRRGIDSK